MPGTGRPTRSQLARVRRRRRFYRLLTGFYRALFPSSAPAVLRPADMTRMLVVRDDRIGDLIVSTTLIGYLRDTAPQAELDVVCSTVNAEVLQGDSRVSRVFVSDKSALGTARLALALRRHRYDAIFSITPGYGFRQGWMAALASRRHTARVSIWRPKRYHGFFTLVVRNPWSMQPMPDQVAYAGMAAFGQASIAGARARPIRMHVPEASHEVVRRFLAGTAATEYVVVNMRSAESWRTWAPEPAAATLRLLSERYPSMHFVLTPPPGHCGEAENVTRAVGRQRLHVFPADARLADRAALIERAGVVITCNTAMVPIASSFGRPVVGLYSNKPTDFNERYLPRGVPQRIVYATPMGGVSDIPPADIVAAFAALLKDIGR